ncbi:MAG: hypothetical protein JWO32_2082 [Bacteroidetes bacterium]|nr:hypothetical protein [Bacteroidota bacterium]
MTCFTDMVKSFKINTAILICTVFVLRLLIINISAVSSFSNSSVGANTKKHFSDTYKRRHLLDPSADKGARELAIEFCEESDNEDDILKSSSVPVFILHSFFSDTLDSFQCNVPFDFIHDKITSKKYLSISVLRI